MTRLVYTIVKDSNINEFVEKVNQRLKEGWSLNGETQFISKYQKNISLYCIQVMTKEVEVDF